MFGSFDLCFECLCSCSFSSSNDFCVILHRNERALEFFFTFANATIVREYCIQVLFQGFVCFLCFTVFQIFKDLVNLLCVKHCWGFCVILHYHKSIHDNMFDLLRIFFKGT
jgi:hypothetical protein